MIAPTTATVTRGSASVILGSRESAVRSPRSASTIATFKGSVTMGFASVTQASRARIVARRSVPTIALARGHVPMGNVCAIQTSPVRIVQSSNVRTIAINGALALRASAFVRPPSLERIAASLFVR